MSQEKGVITVSIAGDSGDGIQLLGQLFARDIARNGFYIKTEPSFPAEIRAPQGTPGGVSGFKLSFAEDDSFAVEKSIDVLVILNPAATTQRLENLRDGGLLIINSDQFKERDFAKAHLDDTLLRVVKKERHGQVLEVPITSQTIQVLKGCELSNAQIKQCKNMYLLGLMLYLFQSSLASSEEAIQLKLQKNPELLEGNLRALQAGYRYFETQEFVLPEVKLSHHPQPAGVYRQVNGNQALAYGALATVHLTELPMLVAGYPITPASSLLHELVKYEDCGIRVLQAEDEIAACGAALGAAYGGRLGLTCTSGPGLDLKSEMIGLAVMTELPLVIVDVQRAGPSTGMPTKTEQSDLLHAIHGRHGESPCVVLAAYSAVNCFDMMIHAYCIALKLRIPVICLSEAAIANSIEVWRIPDHFDSTPFDFLKDPDHPSNQYQIGQADAMRCIGGLEKDPKTWGVSCEPLAHEVMSEQREVKLSQVFSITDGYRYEGPPDADILLVTWGSSDGPSRAAAFSLNQSGGRVGVLTLTIVHPLNREIEPLLRGARSIYVVELNRGQLLDQIRAEFLVGAKGINQLTGEPFHEQAIVAAVLTQEGRDVRAEV